MREIKFRAWDKDKQIMHYDFQFVKSGEGIGQFILYISDKEDNVVKKQNPYPVDRFEIIQYTGLKDKNGKEIYECDILKYDFGNGFRIMVVECNDYAGYSLYFVNYTGDRTYAKNMELVNKSSVIGNKFENPELVEKQNER
jgi:uncharacterized phage protein (TIGR01671 family)